MYTVMLYSLKYTYHIPSSVIGLFVLSWGEVAVIGKEYLFHIFNLMGGGVQNRSRVLI